MLSIPWRNRCQTKANFHLSVLTPTGALKSSLQVLLPGDKNQIQHVALAAFAVEDAGREKIHHLAQLGRLFPRTQHPADSTELVPSIWAVISVVFTTVLS